MEKAEKQHRLDGSMLLFIRKVFIVFAIATLYVCGFLLLWYASDIILIAFASILLAVFLRGITRIVNDRTPLSENWSLLLVTFVVIALLVLSGWLMGAPIGEQIAELRKVIPTSVEGWKALLGRYSWGQAVLEQVEPIKTVFPRGSAIAARVAQFFSNTLYALSSGLLIFIAGIYFASQPKVYVNGIVALIPYRSRDAWSRTLASLGQTLWYWLLGRFLLMASNGILTTLGLWILGIPLALALGLLAGFLNFIPNIGPIIAAIPALIIALAQSPTDALYVLILYLVLQSLDGYVFTPLVEQRSVCLPAAIIIFAQLTFGYLFGFLGLFLATPLAAVIAVVVKMNYLHATAPNEKVA